MAEWLKWLYSRLENLIGRTPASYIFVLFIGMGVMWVIQSQVVTKDVLAKELEVVSSALLEEIEKINKDLEKSNLRQELQFVQSQQDVWKLRLWDREWEIDHQGTPLTERQKGQLQEAEEELKQLRAREETIRNLLRQ
ncbi:MAG: hypothetical protein F4201_10110 [Nitrospira sp. SB0677_bin_15]|nr:hypothetical protein [Nitrospira sp. SB0677_bin_15]